MMPTYKGKCVVCGKRGSRLLGRLSNEGIVTVHPECFDKPFPEETKPQEGE